MTAWTYYSPLWLGVLLAILMNDTIQGQDSTAATEDRIGSRRTGTVHSGGFMRR